MRWLKLILETLFWMLAGGVVLFAVGTVIGITMSPVLGYLGGVVALGFLPMMVRFARILRRRRGAAVISYLEQAVRLNLPLSRMLYVAQRSEPGKLSYRLAGLRQLLEDGYPIGPAVEAGVPEVTARQAAMIEVAERVGRLPQVLRKLVREQNEDAVRQQAADVSFYRVYPFIMLVMMSAVMAMTSIFVLPKYQQIFRDFNVKLPWLTLAVFDVALTLGPFVLAIVGAAVLLWTGASLWQTFHPVRLASVLDRGWIDRLIWITPLAGTIARDRGLSDALDLLAYAIRIGTPSDRALSEASQLEVNAVLRRKFAGWSDAVAGGASIADGARQVGMPALVVSMLSTAHGSDASAQVLEFLARYYHTRFSRLATLLEAAMVPIVVFFFGFLVACIALSLFLPLISLIQNISGHAGRWHL